MPRTRRGLMARARLDALSTWRSFNDNYPRRIPNGFSSVPIRALGSCRMRCSVYSSFTVNSGGFFVREGRELPRDERNDRCRSVRELRGTLNFTGTSVIDKSKWIPVGESISHGRHGTGQKTVRHNTGRERWPTRCKQLRGNASVRLAGHWTAK